MGMVCMKISQQIKNLQIELKYLIQVKIRFLVISHDPPINPPIGGGCGILDVL